MKKVSVKIEVWQRLHRENNTVDDTIHFRILRTEFLIGESHVYGFRL